MPADMAGVWWNGAPSPPSTQPEAAKLQKRARRTTLPAQSTKYPFPISPPLSPPSLDHHPTFQPPPAAPPPPLYRHHSSTMSTDTTTRPHLHYRDSERKVYPRHADLPPDSDDALEQALRASERENEEQRAKASKEEADLRRALAESTTLARSRLPSIVSPQEQAELAQALLESQRQALLDSKPPRPPPARRASSQGPLDAEEAWLRMRDSKGSLWEEAGAHGWLPPGAGRANEADEDQMLELAIRISLEEEEARRDFEKQVNKTGVGVVQQPRATPLPPRPAAVAASAPIASSSQPPSPTRLRSSPPKRPPPPPPAPIFPKYTAPTSPPASPQPHYSLAPPSPATYRRLSQQPRAAAAATAAPPPLPTRAPPSPPPSDLDELDSPLPLHISPWSENNRAATGSPVEIPYLTPSSLRGSGSFHSSSTSLHRSSTSSYSSHQQSIESGRDELPGANLSNEGLRITNPDDYPLTTQQEPLFPDFEPTSLGRALSQVSERTEASTSRVESPSPVEAPQVMRAMFITRSPPEASVDAVAPIESLLGATALVDEQQQHESFGDGVRFGYPSLCAHQLDHVCSMDGLSSIGPFPAEVELSALNEGSEKAAFSVEARSWAGLLRFLMWFGETTIVASRADVAADSSHRCEATLSLSFRQDDLGQSVLRLTINLLPPNHASPYPELTQLDSATMGKGKSRSTTTSSSTTFLLPDPLHLPTRLSSISLSLYTLRHLSSIALSTQPSKSASPSYLALRSLGHSIAGLSLSSTSTNGSNKDDLVGRLRERVRRLRAGGAERMGGGGGGGAKLAKPAPNTERTRPVERGDRLLMRTSSREGAAGAVGLPEVDYLPTLGRV